MDQQLLARFDAWMDAHFEELVGHIARLTAIPSVSRYDDPDTPFGPDCKQALDEALALARSFGFATENYENRCGSATMRPGKTPADEITFWGHLDVVPAGDGWTMTEPFKPLRRGDWLIGRGADDNKGPALGVLYILRAFEELNIPTRHGLRIFFGCDEEKKMQDAAWYARTHEGAALTMIADSGFPVCYGEKGILTADIVSRESLDSVAELQAGTASNMVPAQAVMALRGNACPEDTEWTHAEAANGLVRIEARGVSAHTSAPDTGVNAIHQVMTAALASDCLSESDSQVIGFMKRVNDDTRGAALGLCGEDEISGHTTCVGSMASRLDDGRVKMHINVRYCITADDQALLENLTQLCEASGCTVQNLEISKPNYFPPEQPVVGALTKLFNDMTQSDRKPFVMGGGTYARKFQNALAYGLGGLPKPEGIKTYGGAHQPDEGLYLPNLRKALSIFAMGILTADECI